MVLHKPYTLTELTALLDATFIGAPDHLITGINEIHRVVPGDLVFVDHPKYYEKALNSEATTILIDQEVPCPPGKALIISKTPFDDFNRLTRHFNPFQLVQSNRGKQTSIDPSAQIHPTAVIGERVKIGKNVVVYPGVYIGNDCVIENDVFIGPNSVIGHLTECTPVVPYTSKQMLKLGHYAPLMQE
jgi:UDP-3-O-[3-hydroxymyristoyl] glucosamine N-acyltransferase